MLRTLGAISTGEVLGEIFSELCKESVFVSKYHVLSSICLRMNLFKTQAKPGAALQTPFLLIDCLSRYLPIYLLKLNGKSSQSKIA